MKARRLILAMLMISAAFGTRAQDADSDSPAASPPPLVCVVAIREDITFNTLFLVRRAVKEAVDRRAVALLLDMNTNGGRVDATEEILRVLQRSPIPTITFVNQKAYSAGAYIAAATDKIYMAPASVIGAATPIELLPGNQAKSVDEKHSSALRALIRTTAQGQGHNADVFEAMVDADRGLTVEGKEITPKGKLLTLTNEEAAREYGSPAKPLLSIGTLKTVGEVLAKEGLAGAETFSVKPYGFELLGRWIAHISTILILIGFAAIWVEMKAPGIGAAAVVAAICFGIYFLGTFVAGLSGWEEMTLFALGVVLLAIEVFILPGFGLAGILGITAMLAALVLAMTQHVPGGSFWLDATQLRQAFINVAIGFGGSVVLLILLARFLPETRLFKKLELNTDLTAAVSAGPQPQLLGERGVAETVLRPAGKGRFGEQLVDVVTEGDLIPRGSPIKIIEVNGSRVVVKQA